MRNQIVLIATVFAAIVLSACAADRGDILSSNLDEFGGRLTQGASRANLAVNSDNIYEACQKIITPAFTAFENSLSVLAGSDDSTRIVRVPGDFHGYSEVSGISLVREDNRVVDYNIYLALFDYSDSGYVFLGGRINCSGEISLSGSSRIIRRLILNGGMAFAGDFKGEVIFDTLWVNLNLEGKLNSTLATYCETDVKIFDGNLRMRSGNNNFTLNPWFKPWVECN